MKFGLKADNLDCRPAADDEDCNKTVNRNLFRGVFFCPFILFLPFLFPAFPSFSLFFPASTWPLKPS